VHTMSMLQSDAPVSDQAFTISQLELKNSVLENQLELTKRDLRTAADAAVALDSHINGMVTECKDALMDCNLFCVQADMHTNEVINRMRVTDARFLSVSNENQFLRGDNAILGADYDAVANDRNVARDDANIHRRNHQIAQRRVARRDKTIDKLKEDITTLRIKNIRLLKENRQANEGLTLKEENEAMKRYILQLQSAEIELKSELAKTQQENAMLMKSLMMGMAGEEGEAGPSAAGGKKKRERTEVLADTLMDAFARRLAPAAAGRLIHMTSDGAFGGEGLTFSSFSSSGGPA